MTDEEARSDDVMQDETQTQSESERLKTSRLTEPARSGTEPPDSGGRDALMDGAERDALLSSSDGSAFQERWKEIQVHFVDEPQMAVKDADSLVVELIQQLAATFADERSRLEGEWERGADVSTEDLRQALRHYRSFFNRLLAA